MVFWQVLPSVPEQHEPIGSISPPPLYVGSSLQQDQQFQEYLNQLFGGNQ